MASPLSAAMFTVITLSLLIPATVSLPYTINVDDNMLNEVCNTTKMPNDCLDMLKSNPKTSSADIPGLCQIAVTKANATVYDNYGLLQFLLNKTTDPEVRERATLCMNAYNLAIGEMGSADSELKSGDYDGVDAAVQGCMTHATECTTGFKPYPPFLPMENGKLYTICQAVVNIVGIIKTGKV